MVISIHALREERDDALFIVPHKPPLISIHALREERDLARKRFLLNERISIHALREERDRDKARGGQPAGDFNPRAPRGARRVSSYLQSM